MIQKVCGVQTLGSQPNCCKPEFPTEYRFSRQIASVISKYNEQIVSPQPSSLLFFLSLFSLTYGDFSILFFFLVISLHNSLLYHFLSPFMLLGKAYLPHLFTPKIIVLPKCNVLVNIDGKMTGSSAVNKENKGKLELHSVIWCQRTIPNTVLQEAFSYL